MYVLSKKSLFNEKGITLIELIAVIMIIGIITAVGVPIVFNQIDKASENTDAVNVSVINGAIERYALINGLYPRVRIEDLMGKGAHNMELLLTELNTDTNGGPYIRDDFPTNPRVKGKEWKFETVEGRVTGVALGEGLTTVGKLPPPSDPSGLSRK